MQRILRYRIGIIGVIGLLVFQAVVLFIFDQPAFCACGEIKLWEGVVASVGNSQQISDWYTASHVIHGILFFGFLSLVFPRLSLVYRLLIALGIEIGWEITENTPWIINLYRQQALAAGYAGDSILNSISDSLAMMLGFILAWRLPLWGSILLVITAEVFVGLMIHDNLTLNILNFLWPLEFVHQWQSS